MFGKLFGAFTGLSMMYKLLIIGGLVLSALGFYALQIHRADGRGYARAHEECILGQAKADQAAVVKWQATQTEGNTKAVADLAVSEQRRLAAEAEATKAKANYAAAKRAKPLPVDCVLDAARVEAANAALHRK